MDHGSLNTVESTNLDGPPQVFVSYTHETPEHKRWVARFAEDLRNNGVDAILDQWEVQFGDDLTLFMERGIRESVRVVLICTPTYAKKSDEGEGGVGYERLVVTGEIAAKIDTNKFICILRTGNREASLPTFAKTRLFVDFTEDAAYQLALEELLRDIHQTPALPKPAVGPNPFKDSVSEEISSKIDAFSDISGSADVEKLYTQAEHLLRARDLLGWKRLVRSVRAQLPTQLNSWRSSAESLVSTNLTKDAWQQEMHNGCRCTAPLMLLALTAVDSEIEVLIDQRGLLDDLINLAHWNHAGYDIVVDAPTTFAYVYHNVLGSFLLRNNRHLDAVNLLRTRVSVIRGSENTEDLWQSPEMLGWLPSFDNDIRQSWQFISAIWENQPWLTHFFVQSTELALGIRSYFLLANFLDLAGFIARGGDPNLIEGERFSLGVPPIALAPGTNFSDIPPINKAMSLAAPSKAIIESIADSVECPINNFYDAWPKYFNAMLQMAERIFGLRRVYMANQGIPKLP